MAEAASGVNRRTSGSRAVASPGCSRLLRSAFGPSRLPSNELNGQVPSIDFFVNRESRHFRKDPGFAPSKISTSRPTSAFRLGGISNRSPPTDQLECSFGHRMAELVTIPISHFEYIAKFSQPIFVLWLERASVVQAVFDSLKPWAVDLDDVEAITIGKTSEQGVNIKLPQKRVSFFFGPGSCRFTKDDADWASADETLEILSAARSALVSATGVVIYKQIAGIALHLQPRQKNFIEVLSPFISKNLHGAGDPIQTAASIIKWEKSKLILDGSGSIANGVFLRFDRDFGGDATLEEMAATLRADEEAVFNIINVQEDRS